MLSCRVYSSLGPEGDELDTFGYHEQCEGENIQIMR